MIFIYELIVISDNNDDFFWNPEKSIEVGLLEANWNNFLYLCLVFKKNLYNYVYTKDRNLLEYGVFDINIFILFLWCIIFWRFWKNLLIDLRCKVDILWKYQDVMIHLYNEWFQRSCQLLWDTKWKLKFYWNPESPDKKYPSYYHEVDLVKAIFHGIAALAFMSTLNVTCFTLNLTCKMDFLLESIESGS